MKKTVEWLKYTWFRKRARREVRQRFFPPTQCQSLVSVIPVSDYWSDFDVDEALRLFEMRITEMQQNPEKESVMLWVCDWGRCYQCDIQLIRDGEGYLIKDRKCDNPAAIEIRDPQKLKELCEATREAFNDYVNEV